MTRLYSSALLAALLMPCVGMAHVNDDLTHNLSASLSLPREAAKGAKSNVGITITNNGNTTEQNYRVEILADDEVLLDSVVSQPINPDGTAQIFASYKPSVFSDADETTIEGKVILDGDEDEADNDVKASLALAAPKNSPVENLEATESANGGVNLTWNTPHPAPIDVTEDFEDYSPWATSFGDWTTYDGNKGNAGFLYQDFRYGSQDQKFAYTIFNPEDLVKGSTSTYSFLKPHSGNQFAAVPYELDDNYDNILPGDNWLISPLLPGNSQTISLYANNATVNGLAFTETFDILYSTLDNDYRSFRKIGDTHQQGSSEWTEYTATLPQGSRYFAIHQNSPMAGSYLFEIDDISFTRAGAAAKSYNIYVDGKYYATVSTLNAIVDRVASSGNHTYSVTAVDEDGNESVPVDVDFNVTDGIDNVSILQSQQKDAVVYDLQGRRVVKPHNGVFIINGKKVIEK